MSEIKFLIYPFISLVIVIGLLKLANYKKKERYKQTWVPLTALIILVITVTLDQLISEAFFEFLFDLYPNLVDYLYLFLNFMILSVFMLIKVGIKSLAKLKNLIFRNRKVYKRSFFSRFVINPILALLPENLRKKLKRKDKRTVAFFYQATPYGIKLKPEWYFGYPFFVMMSLIPLGFFMFYIVNGAYLWVSPSYLDLPVYPIPVFLLLIEIGWFFNGELSNNREGSITGKDAHSKVITQYDLLYKEYKRVFPDRILIAHSLITNEKGKKKEVSYFQVPDEGKTKSDVIANGLCKRMKQDQKIIRNVDYRVLKNLLNEQDILIEHPNYDEFSPIFFAGIYQLLVKGKKIIVVVKDQSDLAEAKQMFRNGLTNEVSGFQFIWKVEALQDTLEKNIHADIILVTPEDLLKQSLYIFLNNNVDVALYNVLIVLNGGQLLSEYDQLLHTFVWKLQDYLQKMPQKIVLSNWYESLNEEIEHALLTKVEDISVKLPKSDNLFFMVWKKEGNEWLQSRILPSFVHRRLDAEAVIAMPAIKYGISTIQFGFQQKSSTEESIKELIDKRSSLLTYGLTPGLIETLNSKLDCHTSEFILERKDNQFFIVKDLDHNFINTLAHFWSYGRLNSFVHVVTPPYLLRDYLVENFSFFMDNSEKVSPLVPELSQTKWSVAYVLFERLTHSFMTKEDIMGYLNKVQRNYAENQLDLPINERLNQLLKQGLGEGTDFLPFIEKVEENIFKPNLMEFEQHEKYRLTPHIYSDFLPDYFRFIDLKTPSGEVITKILLGNLYQNYLPGQIHEFKGKRYKIEAINLHNYTVELGFESTTDKTTYHPIKSYLLEEAALTCNNKYSNDKTITLDNSELKIELFESQVQGLTHGYFEFQNGVNLKSERLKRPQNEADLKRQYEKGNVLKLTWRFKDRKFESPNKVAYSLSFLLNELFKTLFPHSFQYIAVTTPTPLEFSSGDSFLKNLKRYIPRVDGIQTENTSETLFLYIFEDTPLHMGLLERIKDKIIHIFDLLDDYLYWLLEECNQEGQDVYPYLGNESCPEVFDFDEVHQIIHSILPDHSLRTLRNSVQQTRDHEDEMDLRECDFCFASFPATEFIQLDDERERCQVCHQTSIDTVDELVPLYEEVRQFFINDLKISLRQDIHIKMVNAKELQELSGQSFEPTEKFNPRIVGKAIQQNDQAHIYIENGSTRVLTLSTLAHELTHIWQYDNLIIKSFSLEELEGLASWVEVFFLESMAEIQQAERLKEQLSEGKDEYGKGYLLILEKLESLDEGETPFDLY